MKQYNKVQKKYIDQKTIEDYTEEDEEYKKE